MKRFNHFIKAIGLELLKNKFFAASYFTYWLRPKNASNYTMQLTGMYGGGQMTNVQFAILLQGLIKKEYNFTLETAKLYKNYYPEAALILSVWDSEPESLLEEFRKIGCIVCLSKTFEKKSGYDSINLQRQTTLTGVNKAMELGCTHLAKTRTDQRICVPDMLSYLLNLQKVFPIKIKSSAQERIISCSTETFSNRLYNVSDLFLFGTIQDMYRYFSCPLDERDEAVPQKYDDQSDQIEYSKLRHGEIYFASHYIESCGFELKWTVEDSSHYIKELFLIVDSESIDQYWAKYTDLEYRWRRYQPDVLQQITFKNWLNLYCAEE